jgi:hypothetical protein
MAEFMDGVTQALDAFRSQLHIRENPEHKKNMAETFWHEVTHCVLHDMSHPLWKDEKFVTAFSQRLNQVVHTARFF